MDPQVLQNAIRTLVLVSAPGEGRGQSRELVGDSEERSDEGEGELGVAQAGNWYESSSLLMAVTVQQ